mgnify:CR=1 FL=1
MTTIVPRFPIKIFQSHEDAQYTSSMVAFIIVDDKGNDFFANM